MNSTLLKKTVVTNEHNATVKNNDWGFIDDFFYDGTEYLLTARIDASLYFPTNKISKLNISLPAGQRIDLECKLEWSLQTSYDKNLFILGMVVLFPPREFKEYMKGVNHIHKANVIFINASEY